MQKKKVEERKRINTLLDGKQQPGTNEMQTFITDVMIAYRTAFPDGLLPGTEIFREVIDRKFFPEKAREAQLQMLEKLMKAKVMPSKATLVAQLNVLSPEQVERLATLFPELKPVQQ